MAKFPAQFNSFRRNSPVLHPKFHFACTLEHPHQADRNMSFESRGEYHISLADLAVVTGVLCVGAAVAAVASLFREE